MPDQSRRNLLKTLLVLPFVGLGILTRKRLPKIGDRVQIINDFYDMKGNPVASRFRGTTGKICRIYYPTESHVKEVTYVIDNLNRAPTNSLLEGLVYITCQIYHFNLI